MIYNVDSNVLLSPKTKDGADTDILYDKNGAQVFAGGIDYRTYTKTAYCGLALANMQGFDINSGIIFQFRAGSAVNNTMCTINAANGSIIQNNIAASSEHGDSASFSKEKYNEADDYPLLYVTSDTNPAKVYVNRVTQTTSSLVKTLVFPLDKTGYYAAHAYDEENGVMYMIGYSERNYLSSNDGSNKTVISRWDMTELNDNNDGTYTPAYISRTDREFIYCTQGQQYKNGMIWIASGYTGSAESYIYALNPDTGETVVTIDLETTTEVEGLTFISGNEMIVGLAGGTYTKYTFGKRD